MGRVDVLGADLGAVAHRGASPHTRIGMTEFHPLRAAVVARIGIVAVHQRQDSGPGEVRIHAVLRARRVTQHAIDTSAELPVLFELLWCLQVFTLLESPHLLRDQVRLDLRKLVHEVVDHYHQVALDREVLERSHAQFSRIVIAQEVPATQLGTPLIIMPQLPQIAMRHDHLKLSVPSRSSLMYCSPCNTDQSSSRRELHILW